MTANTASENHQTFLPTAGRVSGVTVESAPDRAVLRSWLPGYLALAAIWGSSFLFIKIGVRELHPVHLTLYRVGAGAATLLILLAVLRDRLPREPRVWAHLVVTGGIGVALPFTLFGYGGGSGSSPCSPGSGTPPHRWSCFPWRCWSSAPNG